ncbi:universal stress protein [Spelaeicoccus albus]|uniref:Nucleotide-binding universal stress UspA family protein n=1 Tax=Spelaeicoccus albus TaxID=1280376 RepID=A0A7Z0D1Y6_9MICO|nr:universal stress protein [Spelaeicoccus albus]NYI67180.1 nucleotide-binding universal stress UspA family protein [Spelaeicoccus albus]
MTIVVGYVPTSQGNAALDRAIIEARRDGGQKLIVVNASRSDPLEGDKSIAAPEKLAQIRRQLDFAGVDYDIRQPLRGQDPAGEIVQTATDLGASLIVIGLRKRSPVGKMIFGSTAQAVLLDAECPVLAVKAA